VTMRPRATTFTQCVTRTIQWCRAARRRTRGVVAARASCVSPNACPAAVVIAITPPVYGALWVSCVTLRVAAVEAAASRASSRLRSPPAITTLALSEAWPQSPVASHLPCVARESPSSSRRGTSRCMTLRPTAPERSVRPRGRVGAPDERHAPRASAAPTEPSRQTYRRKPPLYSFRPAPRAHRGARVAGGNLTRIGRAIYRRMRKQWRTRSITSSSVMTSRA